MSTLPLSIFIITNNEERRLQRTLAALRGLGDEIIVVDSGSTDRTVQIAEEAGAKTFVNAPFPGYGQQKSYAQSVCRNDWVLNIDADEVVTPALREEIRSFLENRAHGADAVAIPIVDVLPGEEANPLFGYSVRPIRLYRKSVVGYGDHLVHDRVVTTPAARIDAFSGVILHYSVETFAHQFDKLARYSHLQASEFRKSGRRPHFMRVYSEFPVAFLKYYFLRRYILRGVSGFLASMNYAIYRHVRIVRAIEDETR